MKKDFQKSTDDDIDDFLTKKSSSTGSSAAKKADEEPSAQPQKRKEEAKPEESDEDKEEQIRVARSSRAQAEAYQDVAILRKKAHEHSHKAAKLYHKYKANQARAQRCSSRAVSLREKSDERQEKAKGHRSCIKEYEDELAGAAGEDSDLSPEALQTKIANLERKAAKQEEKARKHERGASLQTEKAAKFRSRAARFLEKSRLHDSEARMFTKRADNLERAG
jgi:hypothetical protein